MTAVTHAQLTSPTPPSPPPPTHKQKSFEELLERLAPAAESANAAALAELQLAAAAEATCQRALALWERWHTESHAPSKALAVVLARKLPVDFHAALPDALQEMLA